MPYRNPSKKVARIRIEGPDRQGIICTLTTFLFQNRCNIEDIDQRIHEGYLIMTMLVDMTLLKIPLPQFLIQLNQAANQVGTRASLTQLNKKQLKNVALLVSFEDHCLLDLLTLFKSKKLKGKPVVVIGNHPPLESLAKKFGLPFHCVPSDNRKTHENRVLELLQQYDTDLVVLARYMQILSPDFVFRYEGRIINIHPSLLPAFPGPRSYHQAHNKGVEIAGVTAHFVTTNLDEGPIITQECFKINKANETVENMIAQGRQLEAKALSRAVKLFLEDRLYLRRGKVYHRHKKNDSETNLELFIESQKNQG